MAPKSGGVVECRIRVAPEDDGDSSGARESMSTGMPVEIARLLYDAGRWSDSTESSGDFRFPTTVEDEDGGAALDEYSATN